MGNHYIQYQVDEGFIVIELDEIINESTDSSVIKAGLGNKLGSSVHTLKVRFDDALDIVSYSANAFAKKVKALEDPPDEMELSFGIKATGEGDLVVAKTCLEASFNIRISWKK